MLEPENLWHFCFTQCPNFQQREQKSACIISLISLRRYTMYLQEVLLIGQMHSPYS